MVNQWCYKMIWRAVVLSLLAFFSGMIGLWSADRNPPTIQLEERVLNPTLAAGEPLRIYYKVRRDDNCRVRLEQLLFDHNLTRHRIPDEDYQAAPGPIGIEDFVILVDVPRRFAQGEGRYRAIRTYRCNPIHNLFPIVVISRDVTFTVVGTQEARPSLELPGDRVQREDEVR